MPVVYGDIQIVAYTDEEFFFKPVVPNMESVKCRKGLSFYFNSVRNHNLLLPM